MQKNKKTGILAKNLMQEFENAKVIERLDSDFTKTFNQKIDSIDRGIDTIIKILQQAKKH